MLRYVPGLVADGPVMIAMTEDNLQREPVNGIALQVPHEQALNVLNEKWKIGYDWGSFGELGKYHAYRSK